MFETSSILILNTSYFVFFITSKPYGYPNPIFSPASDEDPSYDDSTYTSPTTYINYPAPNYYAIIPPNSTLDEAQGILMQLADNKWIDLETAAVFVDSLVYNPSTDMIMHLRMSCEFSTSGRVRTNVESMVAFVYSNNGYWNSQFRMNAILSFFLLLNFFRMLYKLAKIVKSSNYFGLCGGELNEQTSKEKKQVFDYQPT